MTALAAAASLVIWASAQAFLIAGTALTFKRFRWNRSQRDSQADFTSSRAPKVRARDLSPPPGPWKAFAASARPLYSKFPGISVLKPLKGADQNLEACLQSFFEQNYPCFELLFCVAEREDQAVAIVERLIAKHPRVRARLTIGAACVGINPKVNNMAKSYALARHDRILISDSNVKAKPDYLEQMARDFDDRAGVLTSVVVGIEPKSWAGRLEAVGLNCYYSRWMMLADAVGAPVVMGKSMSFRREQAERFGGLHTLGRYLAEDYMSGRAMALLGLRSQVASRPVEQPIGHFTLKAFWARHLRWGRIRKSQASHLFLSEFAVSCIPSGLAGAFGAKFFFGLPLGLFMASHLGLWMTCDIAQALSLGRKFDFYDMLAWAARETLAPALSLHVLCGRTVAWRGSQYRLGRDGILVSEIIRKSM